MRLRRLTVYALCVLASVCGGGAEPATTDPVVVPTAATVSVSLSASTLAVGETTQAAAETRDAKGIVLTTRPLSWSSSAPLVATVGSTGTVTALSVGTTTITAASDGRVGSSTLTVTPASPPAVATMSIALDSLALIVGATLQAVATTRDAAGIVLTGRAITWTSSNVTVATVSASGMVTATAAGTTVITAASEGRSASATITVSPGAPLVTPVATVSVRLVSADLIVGGFTQAVASTLDADGNLLAGRAITWTSTSAVASVSADGRVTGLAAGTASITATSEGKSASAQVTVSPAVQSGLSISVGGAVGGAASVGVTVLGPTGGISNLEVAPGTPTIVSNLAPGVYTVLAQPFLDPSPTGFNYYSAPLAQKTRSITVLAGAVATASFTYELSSGVLAIQASAVPVSGMPCGIVFDTPQATGILSRGLLVNSGENLKSVPGYGPARFSCDAVILQGVSYEPTPVQQAITVPRSTTPLTVSVSYATPAVPGGLSLTASGVPNTAATVRITLSGPRNASSMLNVPTNGSTLSLDGLSPGTYTLTSPSTPVTVNGKTVFYSTSARTVTVVAGEKLAVQLEYVVAP